jgi:predicted nucleic acid-binding protein
VAERVVVDASAIVEVLVDSPFAARVRDRLRDTVWHAPAHLDAEVLSALGRLTRGGHLLEADVPPRLELLASMPVQRQVLPALLLGAWARRPELRLVDALYVELAHQLDAPLITTDPRLARATSLADPIEP